MFRLLSSLACTLTFFSGSALVFSLPAQANSRLLVSVKFPDGSNRGAPSQTRGGGIRGTSCAAKGNPALTALIPHSSNVVTTVAANPTFFWYIPTISEPKTAEFVLKDSQGKQIYKTGLTLPVQPGVLQFQLPETAPLEIGKDYSWRFAVICDATDRGADITIYGKIQRKELDPALKVKLENATLLEQAKLYAQEKVWQETLTTLSQLRSSKPNEWQELLTSVGLDPAIAQAPFIE